jgi:hypothetical protein
MIMSKVTTSFDSVLYLSLIVLSRKNVESVYYLMTTNVAIIIIPNIIINDGMDIFLG